MAFAVYGLKKSYGGVEVLGGVDLQVADGEIHALLGANGAGKSTLIKCLSGAIQPDDGVIIVGADKFDALTPREARQAGIAVVYQDLSLAATLDVADNMFLGQELRFGPFLRKRAQRRRRRAGSTRWGPASPDRRSREPRQCRPAGCGDRQGLTHPTESFDSRRADRRLIRTRSGDARQTSSRIEEAEYAPAVCHAPARRDLRPRRPRDRAARRTCRADGQGFGIRS